jgi:hypothetical protein
MPIYMKIEGVIGPETGEYYGWIELDEFEFHRPIQFKVQKTANQIILRPAHNEVHATKSVDSSHIELIGNMLRGTPATIEIEKAPDEFEPGPTLHLDLEEAFISEVGFPKLDAGSKDPAKMSLKITCDKVRTSYF